VAKQRASSFKQELEIAVSFLAFKFVKILGPSPFPIEKIKKRFHWHLLIKTTEIGLLNQTIRKVLDKTPNSIRNKIRIDVDPAGIF
jgi:primosomal protein N' (replication factor Y)